MYVIICAGCTAGGTALGAAVKWIWIYVLHKNGVH